MVKVTPYAGVWIEIQNKAIALEEQVSLPTRECGLKSYFEYYDGVDARHSLRGSVD